MKKILLFLLLIPYLLLGQMKQETIVFQGITIQKFVPKNIYSDTLGSILWLHGLNGTWSGDSWGVGDQLRRGYEFPFVFYCPQNPDQKEWSSNELKSLKALIELGKHPYNIVTGHSQGGMGTISAINLFPDFWYAAAISAGKTGSIDYLKFINIHIRAWHGEDDTLMGASIYRFIDGIQSLGGDATYIKYPSPIAHNICSRVYDKTDPNSFWKWLDSRLTLKPVIVSEIQIDRVVSTEIENGTKLKLTTESGKVYYQSLN